MHANILLHPKYIYPTSIHMHVALYCLKLNNFSGGLCDAAYVQKRIDLADEADKSGENLSATLHPSGRDDMSILSMQRLNNQYVPLPLKSLLKNKI